MLELVGGVVGPLYGHYTTYNLIHCISTINSYINLSFLREYVTNCIRSKLDTCINWGFMLITYSSFQEKKQCTSLELLISIVIIIWLSLIRIFHYIFSTNFFYLPYTLDVFKIHRMSLNFLIIHHMPLMINDYQLFWSLTPNFVTKS